MSGVNAADYLRRMRSSAVYNVAIRSPLEFAPLLSRRLGNDVWIKREDLQPSFSFKIRGAYNRMARLSPEELERGVVAASAGNHAQGVALAAQRLASHATIVVPVTTQQIKADAIEALGAELLRHGDSYDEAYRHARELAEASGRVMVHPYDHPDVIAGQGTIGLEIAEQAPAELAAVYVAVGGGGLIAGVALALKQLRRGVRIVGVEPEDSDAMRRSLAAGVRVTLDRVGLFADGVAVKTVGEETFRICRDYVDEVITVPNDAICAAIKETFEDRRAVLEPAGALAYAGLRADVERRGLVGQTLVAVACGANLNFDRLRHVAERAQIGEHHEGILAVEIPERPGSFRRLCAALGRRGVTEFNYRMGDPDRATVFVGVQVGGAADLQRVLAGVWEAGFQAEDLTGDEIAKLHVRHMVGGRSGLAEHERVFHFDFPERAGALTQFLDQLAGQWNISLFHYRNHGSDRGRALVGIQVPPASEAEFTRFLAVVGYEFTEETDNASVRRFL